MKRLALLWLTCAAVGFGVAAGVALLLALALDGPAVWTQPQRIAQAAH